MHPIARSDTYVLGRGKLENIIWVYRVRKEKVLQIVKEERNILHRVKRRKGNWIGHSWRRKCLLKHVIEGKREGKELRGRRRKQLLDDLKGNSGYCKLKEEALDRNVWGTGLGRDYVTVVRQTAK